MKLSIYSLKNILFQDQAVSLNCNTEAGQITVLDNHEAMIGVLTAGAIKVGLKDGQEKYFDVKSGFIEIKSDNEVRCIIEQ